MMQSCASVCEGSREVGPFYNGGAKPCADAGAHHLGSSSAVRRRRQTSAETACDCYLLDLAHYGVGRRTTPSGSSPVVRNRHSAMSSLRASATIMILRFLPAATLA